MVVVLGSYDGGNVKKYWNWDFFIKEYVFFLGFDWVYYGGYIFFYDKYIGYKFD